ncbi:MAG: hypothetical protein KBD37_04740 [Burkholderiales bacterium]|nr:hypothetical protein [Burkholderiales bacterium]
MLTKKLNTTILIASQILNFVIILYFAVLLAKLIWWIINPAIGEVYIEKSSATQFDKSIKYIENRHPFGVIVKVVEVKTVAPPIASLIKLTGIYFEPPKNSIAFIEYANSKDNKDNGAKKLTLRLGDSVIEDNAIITEINIDNIVIVQNGSTATISLSKPSNNNSSGAASNISPNPRMPASNNSSDEFKARRRQLLNEFAEKSQAAAAANKNSSEDGGASSGGDLSRDSVVHSNVVHGDALKGSGSGDNSSNSNSNSSGDSPNSASN